MNPKLDSSLQFKLKCIHFLSNFLIHRRFDIILIMFVLIFCLFISGNLFVSIRPISAYTYTAIWWLGYTPDAKPDESPGVVQLYYTYPDSVYTGQKFNVGITIKYVKDNRALVDWIVLSKVSVGIKDYNTLADFFSQKVSNDDFENYPSDLQTENDSSSHLVYPGQQYSFNFNFTAPAIPGKYVIFPTWNAFYGPGTIAANNFVFDTKQYYNQTDRDVGTLYPEDVPPILVKSLNQKQYSSTIGNLDVYFESPYSDLLTINSTLKDLETNLKYTKLTSAEDGYTYFDVPLNKTYLLTVPKILNIVPNKIQALFVNWSDGQAKKESILQTDKPNTISRVIHLDHDMEFVPIYKTQYFLKVSSDNNINLKNNNGTGWYDSGTEAQFSANTFGTFFSLYSFDHWNGTIPKGANTESSSVTTMNGPKEVTAIWRFDYGYLGVYLGLATGIGTVIGKVHSKHGTIKKIAKVFKNKKKNKT